MTINELKKYFLKFPDNQVFHYSLSYPFSWRGSYNEVAFNIENTQSTKESNLKMIEKSLSETFIGWKGGEYQYDEYTTVHFEEDCKACTNGEYVQNFISKIEGTKAFSSPEEKLINIAFTN